MHRVTKRCAAELSLPHRLRTVVAVAAPYMVALWALLRIAHRPLEAVGLTKLTKAVPELRALGKVMRYKLDGLAFLRALDLSAEGALGYSQLAHGTPPMLWVGFALFGRDAHIAGELSKYLKLKEFRLATCRRAMTLHHAPLLAELVHTKALRPLPRAGRVDDQPATGIHHGGSRGWRAGTPGFPPQPPAMMQMPRAKSMPGGGMRF